MSQNILNTSFKMTYNNVTNSLSDMVYQKQYLDAFNIKKYNNKLISDKLDIIYNQLKDHPQIIQSINILENKSMDNIGLYLLLANSLEENKRQNLFSMLFSFEYFYIFHKCYFYYTKNIDNPFQELIQFLSNN